MISVQQESMFALYKKLTIQSAKVYSALEYSNITLCFKSKITSVDETGKHSSLVYYVPCNWYIPPNTVFIDF